MKPSVYLETTIVSLLTARPTRDLVQAAWQQVTQQWWQERREDFSIYASVFVTAEAGRGDPEAARRRLSALRGLPSLPATRAATDLAAKILAEAGLPSKALQDALHIACASIHGMDYLLTWNCTHIANAEFIPGVRTVCSLAGHRCPQICTPQELLGLRS